MRIGRGFAQIAGLLLLAACAQPRDMKPAPDPPADALAIPERMPWGDQTAGRLNSLANHVDQQLRRQLGAPQERHGVGHDANAVAALREWYRTQLGNDWKPLELNFMPEEQGFGFANEGQGVVVAWLPPQPDGRVPVLIIRYDKTGTMPLKKSGLQSR